jgi:hypothetical protein
MGSAAGPAPADAAGVLERVPPERQKLFSLVRELLDELDTAVPWDDLYYPTDVPEVFLARLRALIELIDLVPGRVRELVEVLTLAAADEETRATLEEAEFYFAGIHSMCARDLDRLRHRLAPHLDDAAPAPLLPADRNFLCELAADLKGKYTSALMGATASVVAEDLWSSFEVEPALFPEKADEARRNEGLVLALQRTLRAICELPAQVPPEELLARWRSGARVDPYALADLSTFRGVLGQLLKRDLRRALYSGDYQQIQRREVALATRMAALETAHHRTWAEVPESEEQAAATCRQLVGLTLEIAAILDVELLERLLGAKAVKDLRGAATAQRALPTGGTARRRPLSDELEPLVPVLAEEDLRTFLDLLLGSVLKRSSLANARNPPASSAQPAPQPAATVLLPASPAAPFAARDAELADVDGELLPGLPPELTAPLAADPGSQEVIWEPPPPLAPPSAPSITAPPEVVAQAPPTPASTSPLATPRSTPPSGDRGEVLERLHRRLTSLQAPDNPLWSGFRMLQRLLSRHTRIPPSMVQGAHPFLFEVLNELVPELEAAAAQGLVPAEVRTRLIEACLGLTSTSLTPEQMASDVPAHLGRLQRLLQGLTAATAAQLGSARSS